MGANEQDALAASLMTTEDFPIEPFGDIVIVEQLAQEKTESGLYLPGDHKKFPCGKVIAVGPGRVYTSYLDASGHHQGGHFVPCTVQVGDWVIFGKYNSGGEPIEWNGRKFLMCREGDLGGRSLSREPVRIRLAPTE